MRRWSLVLLPFALGTLLLFACGSKKQDPKDIAAVDTDASTTAAELDGGGTAAISDAGAADKRLVMQLAASNFVASVSDQPDWPENDAGAKRMGYLRNGGVVDAYDPPVKNDECKDGWYELVSGGYICGKHATIDLNSPRVRLAPKQPDRDAGMPYRYGINMSDGTPLYRRVLNADDRQKYERPAKPKSDKPEGEKDSSEKPAEKTESESSGDTEPSLAPEKDKPVASSDDEPPLSQDDEPPPQRKHTKDLSHHKRAKDSKDKHAKKEDKPVKDPFKEAKAKGEKVSLSDLKGRGVLVRKLARGFTIALDRDFKGAGTRWWRTTFGFAVPFDKVAIQAGQTKYVGNWFNGDNAKAELLPVQYPNLADLDASAQVVTPDAGPDSLSGTVGFINFSGASGLEIGEDAKGNPKVSYGGKPLPKRSAVLLTGRTQTVSGMTYYETAGGFYVILSQLKLAHPQIPADVGEHEKWIDVDLTRQQLVAYEGRKPVFATLVSSGRKNLEDPEHNYATPAGAYRIREKHVTATMDADTASDGPYSIEDVPWVMYFQGSYAFHGAFWHDSFGNQRSHGCVNMSPEDARTLFGWSDPPMPNGWHGVFSKDDNTGSRVIVHEDPPPKRR